MDRIPQVYFVSGVCGVGKSSVIVHLKELLHENTFAIHDFDERGVPDGGGRAWGDKETLHWLNVAAENAEHGKSTIICGFANPERFKKLHKKDQHPPAKLFLLHASGDIIRQRILGRYPTPESVKEISRASGVSLEQFVENNVLYAPILHSIFEKEGVLVIETDEKTPEDVAEEIANNIVV